MENKNRKYTRCIYDRSTDTQKKTTLIHVLQAPLYDRFISCRFILRPILGERYYLIAPLHTLYRRPLSARLYKSIDVCILLIFFLQSVCFLYHRCFRRILSLSLPPLHLEAPFLFIFYWPIDFHFCFTIYYNLILNLVYFTSISSIVVLFFFLYFYFGDCLVLVGVQFNFSENVNLFLQYHHHYTVFRLWSYPTLCQCELSSRASPTLCVCVRASLLSNFVLIPPQSVCLFSLHDNSDL